MNAKIYTGTLEGPHGTLVGQFVRMQDAHNVAQQVQLLLEGLAMIAQADTVAEARGIAEDLISGHQRAIAAAGSAH